MTTSDGGYKAANTYAHAYGRLSQTVQLFLRGLVDEDFLRSQLQEAEAELRADLADERSVSTTTEAGAGMSATDPIPAEIRDRIERVREARSAAIRKDSSMDYVAWLREVVAADRELADAYEAAYQFAPVPFQTVNYALLDAYTQLRKVADEDERQVRRWEEARQDRARHELVARDSTTTALPTGSASPPAEL